MNQKIKVIINTSTYKEGTEDKVTDVIISGPISVEQLETYADEFSQKIYRKGISRTSIGGIGLPIINVIVLEKNLIRYDMSLQDIAVLISQEVKSDPAGDLSSGVARLKTGIEKKSIQSL